MVASPADPSPSDFLQLIADPVRWRILEALARSDHRVNELTHLSAKPQSLVSYHLKVLRSAGVVSGQRSSADGRDTYYRLDLARCGRLLGAAGAALHPGLRLGFPPAEAAAVTTARPARALFLCTGNSARSQIAEALLEARSGGAVEARSAGSHPKALHPNAIRVLAARGIDVSGRQAKHLRRFTRMRFDHVVTLCDRVREVCPEFPGHPQVAHWSIPDPALGSGSDDATYPAFERTTAELETRVGFLLHQLIPANHEENAHV